MRIVDQAASSPVRGHAATRRCRVDLPFDVPPTLAGRRRPEEHPCLAGPAGPGRRQHIGDMDDWRTQQAFEAAAAHIEALAGISPEYLAADRHPAPVQPVGRRQRSRPSVRHVQHHHADVASTMAEHSHDGTRRVLGIAFDGTGYGDDGAVWAGSSCSRTTAATPGRRTCAMSRSLAAMPAFATRAAWRCPDLRTAGAGRTRACPASRRAPPTSAWLLDAQLASGTRCVPTSSMGRLFDAVSSIACVCHRVGYEAQAAAELEAAARSARDADGSYAFAVTTDGCLPWPLDAAPVIAAAAADALAGVPAPGDRGPLSPGRRPRGRRCRGTGQGSRRHQRGHPVRRRVRQRAAVHRVRARTGGTGIHRAASSPRTANRRGPRARPGRGSSQTR